ncbi:MAG: hypothetical protein A2Y62_14200, partial [Candidatus Fischerbacteria bacterium RBG_13_37_8]
MIDGVVIQDLFCIEDKRGFLVEIFRSDNPLFENFGQVYMTACYKGIAKAWHYHKYQTDYFFCVWGKALVVLYDNNPDSKTNGQIQEVILENPPSKESIKLVKIPPLIVHGFASLSDPEARIINIPNKLYNYKEPDEYRIAWNSS